MRYAGPRPVLWMSVVLLATIVIVIEGLIELAWAVFGDKWTFLQSPWLEILGFSRSAVFHLQLLAPVVNQPCSY